MARRRRDELSSPGATTSSSASVPRCTRSSRSVDSWVRDGEVRCSPSRNAGHLAHAEPLVGEVAEALSPTSECRSPPPRRPRRRAARAGRSGASPTARDRGSPAASGGARRGALRRDRRAPPRRGGRPRLGVALAKDRLLRGFPRRRGGRPSVTGDAGGLERVARPDAAAAVRARRGRGTTAAQSVVGELGWRGGARPARRGSSLSTR